MYILALPQRNCNPSWHSHKNLVLHLGASFIEIFLVMPSCKEDCAWWLASAVLEMAAFVPPLQWVFKTRKRLTGEK